MTLKDEPPESRDRLARSRISIGGHRLWVEVDQGEDLDAATLEVEMALKELIEPTLPKWLPKKDDA